MQQTDPFASYGGAALDTATPPPKESADPFAQYGGAIFDRAGQSAPRPIPRTQEQDPFSAYGGAVHDSGSQTRTAQTGDQSQASDTNAPWYEKTWDWANKPLIDLHRQGATGFEAGAEDVLSGLTSPLSISLTVGTLGSGTALRALGIAAK